MASSSGMAKRQKTVSPNRDFFATLVTVLKIIPEGDPKDKVEEKIRKLIYWSPELRGENDAYCWGYLRKTLEECLPKTPFTADQSWCEVIGQLMRAEITSEKALHLAGVNVA